MDNNFLFQKWIHEQILKRGISPYKIMKSNHIFSLEIRQANIKIVDSNNFVQGNEYEIADLHEIPYTRLFFPTNLNFIDLENLSYLPNNEVFFNFNDSKSIRQQKIDFYEKEKNNIWNFKEKLASFSYQKAILLCQSICCCIQNCFDLQKRFMPYIDDSNLNKDKMLHPFQDKIVSLSGFFLNLFKAFFLNTENSYAVMNEYGYPQKKSSKLEFVVASFLQFENPNSNYRHNFSNPKGQKFFKQCIPDIYDPIKKEAIFINGCYVHGHIECYDNPNASENSTNFTNKSYKDLNLEFNAKLNALLKNNADEVKSIKVIWECEFNQIKSGDAFQRFEKNIFQDLHPLVRLSPRTCVRGGFLNAYALKWKINLNETFYCLDINGLYSYCAAKYSYVNGPYDVIIGKNISKVSIKNCQFFYDNKKIFGAVLLSIVAPSNLLYPFLPIKLSNGKTVLTLCLKCSETQNKKTCSHTKKQRTFTSCYMINEIEYALTLGYEIVAIYECHAYFDQNQSLKAFVELLNTLKIQHSNIFENMSLNDEDLINNQQSYCDFLNTTMGLSLVKLEPSNIKPNKKMKEFYKLAANALFGKLQQRSDHLKSLFASSQSELENLYFENEETIQNIICYNDIVCEVLLKPDVCKLPPNRKTNLYIGAQITSYARQTIYEHLNTLLKINAKIFYVDTDCLYFVLPKNIQQPLPIDHCLGHFKNVVDGEIQSFYSLGTKNYHLTYKTQHNEIKTMTKLKGLSLQSVNVENEIDLNLYETYIENFVNATITKKSINQLRKKSTYSSYPISQLELHTFSNQINLERIIVKDEIYSSVPYGFNQTF